MGEPAKAIVLGGYGLIGSACMRALSNAGFPVTGVERSLPSAMAVAPDADWIIRDIPTLTVREWEDMLEGVDVVVNASGALQDGSRDNVEAIHVTAVSRLAKAAAKRQIRVIQISAAGVSETASTAFFRTKARGDAALAALAKDWVILRPTLVISSEAYGGTALLRAASAIPLVQPRVFPTAQIQTVYIGDVADAVVAAALGQISSGTIADLTERETRSFPELLAQMRRWQGWPVLAFELPVAGVFLAAIGRVADLLGYLGWRSPLRTTALLALSDGVRGDADTWEKAGGHPCRSLPDTLAAIPATRQERVFARAFLAIPLAIAALSLFWCLSGLITLLDPMRAMSVLSERSAPTWMIAPSVFGGAVADILLGLAIMWRPWAKAAALGMIVLSGAYLVGSIAVAPDLWADPLGPMVKVIPGMVLATLVWLMLDDR
jgi:uncharacterized protein YbjT (DUF2867 family)